jgi:1-acyl-sn-glycerol-3-phosphate acyltransferase
VWGLGFVRVRTRGTPAATEDAGVIVSNHMGLIESAYLVGIYGASVVTTRENARVPFIGSIVRGMRCVTVDRAAGSGLEAIRLRVTQSANSNQLLMFPEGGWVRVCAVFRGCGVWNSHSCSEMK